MDADKLALLTTEERFVAEGRSFQAYREETEEHLTTIATLRAEVAGLRAKAAAWDAACNARDVKSPECGCEICFQQAFDVIRKQQEPA